MKYRVPACALLVLLTVLAYGQAPVIRSTDMFNQPGEYYRAYALEYDYTDPSSAYDVTGLIKPPGPDQLWVFTDGPADLIRRYEYLDATVVPGVALEFPDATIAEQVTEEGTANSEFLFFSQETEGRMVYGVASPRLSADGSSTPLVPAVLDFPDPIRYGDTWRNDYSYASFDFLFSDPDGSSFFATRYEVRSVFTVDAWGTAYLPDLGLVDVLRINEFQEVEVLFDIQIDPESPPQWTSAGTSELRVYRWLSPGHGIVVQIESEPDNAELEFVYAAAYERMFETNKESTPTNNDPKPAANLQVVVDNGKVLLDWDAAENAAGYRVEYSTGGLGSSDWLPLINSTADTAVLDPDGHDGQVRFYRIVSLPTL